MKTWALPTASDWEFWFGWSKRLGIETKDPEFIEADDLRVTIVLSRQIFENRPPTQHEIVRELEEDHLQLLSEYDYLFEDQTKKSRVRSIARYLRSLAQSKRAFLEIVRAREWEVEFGLPKGRDRPHGNEALYRITGRGVLAYEMGLTLPTLSMGLYGFKGDGYTTADFAVQLGILARPGRFQWRRTFLDENQYRVARFHEQVFGQVDAELSETADRFWNLTRPTTLLLREYSALCDLQDWFGRELKDERKEERKAKKAPERDQWDRYNAKTKSNSMVTCEVLARMVRAALNDVVIPEWEKLGFSHRLLAEHRVPKRWSWIG